jgi:uncharacterized membrane protein YjjP (DUF1212 family)
MSLTLQQIKDTTTDLARLAVSSDLKNYLESQGSLPEYQKQIQGMKNATNTLNEEFNQRHAALGGTYQLPLFGTNQDIVLLGFYFSYAFLTFVSLLTVYKNTQSIQNVVYALCLCVILLFVITGLMFKIA